MLRGYVEDFRITTTLPEPLAELRQVRGNDTAEGFAREKFGEAARDGHDYRFYENVLLYVNQGRAGIRGSYQNPGLFGGGADNIRVYEGYRIWLVSSAYAKTLESIVPSGSLTGGAVAKARRFAAHLEDIIASVTESRSHVDEVAGDFAQALRDHMPAVVGITAGFLMFEGASMFLAATPTGVSQAAAAVIQLALAAFGAAGMVEGGVEALGHGSRWLTLAWTAGGRTPVVTEASREFVRMILAIAIAALSYLGAKGNYNNALKIANNLPPAALPALATASASTHAGASAGVGVVQSVGPAGAAGNLTLRLDERQKSALGEGPEVDAMHEQEIDAAQRRARGDRRAANGTQAPTNTDGAALADKRTKDAKHIPPRGDAFAEWFDSITLDELDHFLADQSVDGLRGARDVIGENIRHPRHFHEWLLVIEVRQFKKWGVSMRTIQEGRTLTDATMGKRFRHDGAGGGMMHIQLRRMVQSSNGFPEFLSKLNEWADVEMVPSRSSRWTSDPPRGRYSLPDVLQVRSH